MLDVELWTKHFIHTYLNSELESNWDYSKNPHGTAKLEKNCKKITSNFISELWNNSIE